MRTDRIKNIYKNGFALTHNSQKYLEWNLASEKLDGFFPLKYYAISSFEKCFNN